MNIEYEGVFMKSLFLTSLLLLSVSSFAVPSYESGRLVHSINCRGQMIKAAEEYTKNFLAARGFKFNQEKMYKFIGSQQSTLGNAAGDLCVGMIESAAEPE
jgi:hypothetical protein